MDDLDWQDGAACRSAQLELFYSTDEEDVRAALAFCRSCPVRDPCLEHAMSERETFGVWGGTTERERRRVFRAQRRNRRSREDTAA